jgi:hypothetical protein
MKALIFVALIVAAFAVTEPGMELINKMEKHPYGKQLLNTIEI